MLSTLSYVFQEITGNIPSEVLQLAFQPRKYNTNVESRILTEVIEKYVLPSVNLVGGKRRDIILSSNWKVNVPDDPNYSSLGTTIQGTYYLIPPEARDNRNIVAVVSVSQSIAPGIPGGSINFNATGSFGNTLTSLTSQMLNSRTMAQVPFVPSVDLAGTNMIRCSPLDIVDGIGITVMLEFDSEFINMNQSAVKALAKFALCAVQRYIGNTLRVKIDESEIVSGMEIGIIKQIVEDCYEQGKRYDELLVDVKGGMHYERGQVARMIFSAI